MPLSYTIDHARRIVITRASGTMSDADVEILRRQLAADPAVDPTFAHYIDLRELKRLELSSEMLRALQHTLAFRPTSRGAFVARSAFQLHTAREFTRMGEPDGQAVRTFRSAVAAETWLRKA